MITNTFRNRIENGFEQFGHWIYRHHWIMLILMLGLTFALASNIPKLRMDTSTEGFLHENDPILQQYNSFRDQFGRTELVLITIESKNIFSKPFMQRLKSMHDEIESNVPHLDDITSLINTRNTKGAKGELIVEDLLENWPQNDHAWQALKEQAMANPLYTNMMLSSDGTITTVVLKTDTYSTPDKPDDVMAGFDDDPTSGFDSANDEPRTYLTDQENSELVSAVRDIIDRYQADDFKIYYAGTPVITDVLKKSMQKDIKKFMVMALAAIAFVLFLLFRRLSGVIYPLITVALSLVSTLGLMGLTDTPFKLPTQILPSFLLAVGVGASVHLLAIFYRQLQLDRDQEHPYGNKENAIAHALGHSGLAILMTSLTTAAGLASFSGTDVAPISDLGFIASSGVIMSLIYTLIFIPVLITIFPAKAKGAMDASTEKHGLMDKILTSVAHTSIDKSRTILVISAVIIVVGLAGAMQSKFSHKPFEWLNESTPVRQATDFVNERMGGASSLEVVIDSEKENGLYDPAIMSGLSSLADDIGQYHKGEIVVGKTLSLADMLKEINKALNENRTEFYTIPDDRELIAQEFLLFENSGSDDLEDIVNNQFSQSRFTIKMPFADAVLYPDFIREIEHKFNTMFQNNVLVYTTGISSLMGRTVSASMLSMTQGYLFAAVIITLMMIILIGDFKIGLVSMIPNLTPIILTIGLMGWLNIPIDMFNMLIGSIALGLAVDDTIHFMHNYRRYHHQTDDVKEAVRLTHLSTGRAMLVTTIVLSLGFFLYMFSSMNNIFNFGLLTGFTIIMALLADLYLAPALLNELHKSGLVTDDEDY